jgi:hypothetical protein
MTKRKFVPMTGLENLTEAEKLEYYTNACEFFNVPVELNLLEFLWLDSGIGTKNLVLYAKRGATDIMRASHGIHIDEIKEAINGDFVTFTAKGHDSTGRSDVAIGAAYIRGLTGRNLTNELMTGQTRATRRLTLQLVGGGLLDESEVTAGSQTVSTQSEPLKNLIYIPTARPNEAPGRDITVTAESVTATFAPVITRIEEKIADLHSEEPVKKKRRRRSTAVVLETPGLKIEESDNIPCNAQAEMFPAPMDIHTDIQTDIQATSAPTPAQLAARKALELSLPKLREVSATLEDDEITQMEVALATAKAKKRVDTIKAQKAAAPTEPVFYPEHATFTLPIMASPIAPCTQPVAVPPPVIKDLPKDVQMKEFKNRLFAYTNDILPKGGMKGSEGIGGVEYKIKAFVKLMFSQTEVKYLTVNQWEIFLGYMDEKLAELGQLGLVALIDQRLGVKA